MGKQLPILTQPHKTLRTHVRDLTEAEISSAHVRKLIADMKETLKATPDGVGLAAPQVGKGLGLFIVSEEAEEIDRLEENKKRGIEPTQDATRGPRPYPIREWKYYVFINPRIVRSSRTKVDGTEGCLSVPRVFGNVMRREKMTVEARDEHGRKFTRGVSRFFARVVQHELDHLEGVLFIDKAKDVAKLPERKQGHETKS